MRTMRTSLTLSERGGARGTVSSKRSTNGSWFALECIGSLLPTSNGAALLLELRHGNSWESRGSVVFGLIVMDLVYWNGRVNNTWLNSLTL